MFSKVLNNRTIFEHRQAFSMTNSIASSGLWKKVYLPVFIDITDGTVGCAVSDIWCKM